MARDHANRCPFCGKTSPAEDAHLPKSHKPTCGKRKALERKAAAPDPIDPRVWEFLRDHTDFRRCMEEAAFFAGCVRADGMMGLARTTQRASRRVDHYRAKARACVREAVEAYR